MMMFGFSWLMMALILAVPILLIILLVVGAAGLLQYRTHPIPVTQAQNPLPRPGVDASQLSAPPARYCSHCGAGLQADWTHCPQCGAPIH